MFDLQIYLTKSRTVFCFVVEVCFLATKSRIRFSWSSWIGSHFSCRSIQARAKSRAWRASLYERMFSFLYRLHLLCRLQSLPHFLNCPQSPRRSWCGNQSFMSTGPQCDELGILESVFASFPSFSFADSVLGSLSETRFLQYVPASKPVGHASFEVLEATTLYCTWSDNR